MTDIRVVSAIADKKNLTLYTEDGNTVVVPQGDPRVAVLLEKIIPFTARGEVAIVSLETFSVYGAFEKKTNGLVRFLKIAKEKVKNFFSGSEEALEETLKPVEEAAEHVVEEVNKALENIGAPLTAEDVIAQAEKLGTDDTVKPHETIVAVISDGPVQKVIPGAENLREQIAHATSSGRTIGTENLIKRMAKMMNGQRNHSVEDLLRFLERGDLPVADDGSIIAYKRVQSTSEEGVFVDCHSKKVKQRVGSFVVVDESMVDKNRRNECSNGLHIGRRAYMGSFSGDVMLLCKIAPEDVITVPHGDPNKVRVCAYHILAVIPREAATKINNNTPMTSVPEASELLARAMSGKHIGKLEEVRITEEKGGGLKITQLNPDGSKKLAKAEVTVEEKQKAKAFDDAEAPAAAVDVKKINQQVAAEEAKAAQEKEIPHSELNPDAGVTGTLTGEGTKAAEEKSLGPVLVGSNRERGLSAYTDVINESLSLKERQTSAQELLSIKKKAKISWEKLGLPHDMTVILNHVLELKEEPKKEEPAKTSSGFGKKDLARDYFNNQRWAALKDLKKQAKVSWERLGFSDKEIEEITKHL
ncbi:rIIB protector from prophage-induced early lysis protein [Rhizobium phage RHph_X2_28B]|uniref:RIIB lysis inhibitor n=1 Tax=Rhizobium phage RHph_X2_28B TaxID=2836086 RepID=UPI0023295B58|nr:RIIB lysis inhibitor [Rhizobium phage RHph_X2_28B]QWY83503.1 rIIB protector from prophage-induced early lysis protein [Rhizobium phage RHph_X2_28B]QWY83739.1 rIIB protector from prophage-induced early lysis protein [Rhizobium phage RHph_X3_15]